MNQKFKDDINNILSHHRGLKEDIYKFFILFQRFEYAVGLKYFKGTCRCDLPDSSDKKMCYTSVDWGKFKDDISNSSLKISAEEGQENEEKRLLYSKIKKFCLDSKNFTKYKYSTDNEDEYLYEDLISTLLNVRNNLFHGSKGNEISQAISNGTLPDYDVIKNSILVLENFIFKLKSLERGSDLQSVYDNFIDLRY